APEAHQHFTKGPQGSSFVAVDSESTVHIVWEDLRNFVSETTYCRDIYYATINGSTVSKNIKVNYVDPDVASVNAADPYIVFDSLDNFFLVFSDAPSGDNSQHYIYFQSIIISTDQPSNISSFHLIPVFIAVSVLLMYKRKE
ncbi:MAG: hypothetical protein ACXAC7_18210, partial [Candidatus Hodarchaeales archaeon]